MEWVGNYLGLTIFVILVAVFVPLERLASFHDQPVFRRNWLHDLSFYVLNRFVVYAGGLYMVAVALFLNNEVVPEAVTTTVSELPLWIAVPLAILVADLTFYTVHRASHTFPVLWQSTAVHSNVRIPSACSPGSSSAPHSATGTTAQRRLPAIKISLANWPSSIGYSVPRTTRMIDNLRCTESTIRSATPMSKRFYIQ